MKKTLALCVILGNEEATIERFLRSFAPIVDTFCFVWAVGDGTSDKSYIVAAQTCQELGIGYVWERYRNMVPDVPHVDDFSSARNLSWELGRKTGHDLLMWADCDDLLPDTSAKAILESLGSPYDVFLLPYEVKGKKQIVLRERIVSNTGFSRWKYPVHELLTFSREVTYGHLANAPIIHLPTTEKIIIPDRNKNILKSQVEDSARSYYYLHMEANERNQDQEARKWGQAALRAPGIGQLERYEVLLNLAQLTQSSWESRVLASEAFGVMPDRREALALLVNYDLLDGDYYNAEKRARLMMGIPRPSRSYYTLNQEWYDWKGLYLYTHALRRAGKTEEADVTERKQIGESPDFSIIHPTLGRPQQALAIRELWLSYADRPMSVEYLFGLHEDDGDGEAILGGYRHTVNSRETPGCCPNTLAPLRSSRGAFVMVVADDLIPFPGWDTQLKETLRYHGNTVNTQTIETRGWWENPLALNFDDGIRTDGQMCHAFMTRPYLEQVLKDPWPGTGIFSDNEFTHRARKAGVVIDAPEIIFEHRHPVAGKAEWDATYADQNNRDNYVEGLRLLLERNPDIKDPTEGEKV